MRDFNRERKFDNIEPRRRFSSRAGKGPRRFERNSQSHDRRDFGNSDFEKKRFHAICDKCGDSCELPFKPTGGRPVYCSNCFRKDDNSEPRGKFKKRIDEPSGNEFGKELFEINKKLDLILESLARK
ncbi:MAG: CxxC-x17-CxxC domain-containing protein [Nanoarchaeota archaeon]